jgi:arsenite methyltransferase
MPTANLKLDTPQLAERYDRLSADRQFRRGKLLISELAIGPDEKVLDVGCGTGALAQYVADLVGPAGSVLGIDPLEHRVAMAQRRARANLSFQVGSADDLGALPNATYDVVYLNAVFHWLSEKLGPLQQIFRVLKSGGRLGLSTLSEERNNHVRTVTLRVVARPPFDAHKGKLGRIIHRVGKSELERLLNTAGFAIKKVDVSEHSQYFPTPEALLEFVEASSFGNFLGHLPEDLRASARSAIANELVQFVTPEGIPRESTRIVAVAVKP